MLYSSLIWLTLGIIEPKSYEAPLQSYLGLAQGCCDVVYLNNSVFRPWKYENIHFMGPDKCRNTSMVSMYRFKVNKSRSFRCGNGFNVMSFFIALLDFIGTKRTSREEELFSLLIKMKKVYLTTFSSNTTDTSQFSIVKFALSSNTGSVKPKVSTARPSVYGYETSPAVSYG